MSASAPSRQKLAALSLAALGVVYGDIGTSPLYAVRECFHGKHALPIISETVLGVLSLILGALIALVTIKYIVFVMKADNKGEGGILALMALAFPERSKPERVRTTSFLVSLGVFGAALLYGDGVITPAISVLSAVEGLEIATPQLQHFVIPITMIILILLFVLQAAGTGRVGSIFGPVTLVWFIVIAFLGLVEVVRTPEILRAFNPIYGIRFLFHHTTGSLSVLGAVFLVATGAEALYADMGHFGKEPIRLAWFSVVLPALAANYLGQGALLLRNPLAVENPFYRLAPGWALYPLVALATAATVIASQALISGAYSLTLQAMQLGYCPRLLVRHTSEDERGQIYIPRVNWALMIACLGLVLGFRSSTNLASAYGIAVTLTMLITTLLFYFAARRQWHWPPLAAAAVCGIFGVIEGVFFWANTLKIYHGGWFALVAAGLVFAVMSTWRRGRVLLFQKLRSGALDMNAFLEDPQIKKCARVRGTAVFMSGNPEGIPLALLHNLKHNKVVHEHVLILTIRIEEEPYVPAEERFKVQPLRHGFYRVLARYGFMEKPNVPVLLRMIRCEELPLQPDDVSYFLSRETLVPGKERGMATWRRKLFGFMTNNSQPASTFFDLPPGRVVELGMQVEF